MVEKAPKRRAQYPFSLKEFEVIDSDLFGPNVNILLAEGLKEEGLPIAISRAKSITRNFQGISSHLVTIGLGNETVAVYRDVQEGHKFQALNRVLSINQLGGILIQVTGFGNRVEDFKPGLSSCGFDKPMERRILSAYWRNMARFVELCGLDIPSSPQESLDSLQPLIFPAWSGFLDVKRALAMEELRLAPIRAAEILRDLPPLGRNDVVQILGSEIQRILREGTQLPMPSIS